MADLDPSQGWVTLHENWSNMVSHWKITITLGKENHLQVHEKTVRAFSPVKAGLRFLNSLGVKRYEDHQMGFEEVEGQK